MWICLKKSDPIDSDGWSYDETFAAAGQPGYSDTFDLVIANRTAADVMALHVRCTSIVGAGNLYAYPQVHEQWGTEVLLRTGVFFKTITGPLPLALLTSGTTTNFNEGAANNSACLLYKLLDDSDLPFAHEKMFWRITNNGLTSGRVRARWEWWVKK